MLRVAAYCRVSTEKEDQAHSFASQKQYFEAYIKSHPDWEFAGVYADEGLSGTSTKKRTAFHRMIDSALCGDIDFIVTKEISRFSRNILDTITYTRKLKAQGIGVLFVSENISTLDPDAELRLNLMGAIAQEESRKISDRVKWGQKRRMEVGVVFGTSLLGYDVKHGKISINPEGARTVRLIYHKFAEERKGAHTIARELREDGILTYRGNSTWSNTSILRILRNEKYCGDLIQKKTITPDYLTHEKKYNRGEEEQVVLRNHHEPIVDRGLWERAQRELERHSRTLSKQTSCGNRYALSGKIKCAECGSSFAARFKQRKDGRRYKAWRCLEAVRNGQRHTDSAGNLVGCSVHKQIREELLHQILQDIVASLDMDTTALMQNITAVLNSVVQQKQASTEKKLRSLQKERLQIEKKTLALIDMYACQEITQAEFQEQKRGYSKELEQVTGQFQTLERENSPDDKKEVLGLLREAQSLLLGQQPDPFFYGYLLDQMEVQKNGHIKIFFHDLPFCWEYALESPRSPS